MVEEIDEVTTAQLLTGSTVQGPRRRNYMGIMEMMRKMGEGDTIVLNLESIAESGIVYSGLHTKARLLRWQGIMKLRVSRRKKQVFIRKESVHG